MCSSDLGVYSHVRVALWSGEEQGLHGSRAYVNKHKDELPRISMCLVDDTGTGKVTGIGLQGRAPLKPLLEPELVSLKELGVQDVKLRGMGGSDHISFEGAGVPGFAFQQHPSEYRLTHHSQSDTFDKAKEPDLIQGTQVMAVMGLQFGYLLGGSILVETVFTWPGSGFLLSKAIINRDVPVLQGTILTLSLVFVATNLIVDLLQSLVDPRIRRA